MEVETPGQIHEKTVKCKCADSTKLLLIRMVFVRYLGAQWTVALHILRFRSTHQYYRTVEYEPNRTIGDGDTLAFVISLFESYTVGNCQYNG